MNELTILPQGLKGQIADGETILTAALQSGIAYPHSCKVGRCGSCKSRLLAGEVEHLPSSRFTLTDDEKAAGYFLACRARAKADVTAAWLAQPTAENDPRTFEGTVLRVDVLTPEIRRVEIGLQEPLAFQAGQFVQLRVGDCPPRSFSMANRPGDRRLVFYVRRMTGGCASGLLHALQPGAAVAGEGPFGGAFLRAAHSGPILAVAGGSGLAPMQAIVEDALTHGMRQPIHLYFGARSEADLMLVEHFHGLMQAHANFRFVPTVDAGSGYRNGRLDEVLAQDWPRFTGNWHAYLAGPPPMVDSVSEALAARGVGRANIFADPFFAGPVEEREMWA